jgi:hypothetical protein
MIYSVWIQQLRLLHCNLCAGVATRNEGPIRTEARAGTLPSGAYTSKRQLSPPLRGRTAKVPIGI